MAAVATTRRFDRARRLAAAARARVASSPFVRRNVERVRRVYVAARGGVSAGARYIARNAAQRARSILDSGTGRLVAMAVGVAAMVVLIPLVRRLFKLEGKTNAAVWVAGIFAAVAFVIWKWFNKPGYALMAAAVAGFVGGSELLARFFAPSNGQPALASNEEPAPQELPDRAATGAPIPQARPAPAGGVNIQRPAAVPNRG